MTMTLLCTNCRGDCCVNKRGSVVGHGSVLALHSCPDCPDGFAPANPLCLMCGGLCCRISASLHTRVSHRSVTHTTHECDCLDGTALAPDLAAERLAALLDAERENTALRAEVDAKSHEAGLYARRMEQAQRSRDDARAEERAAVGALLRSGARAHDEANVPVFAALIAEYADLIERGEHRREETK